VDASGVWASLRTYGRRRFGVLHAARKKRGTSASGAARVRLPATEFDYLDEAHLCRTQRMAFWEKLSDYRVRDERSQTARIQSPAYRRAVASHADERDCFYLVRTRNKDQAACRLSVVQGAFFETIPNQELLKLLWKDLLDQAGVPIAQHQEILNSLTKLERDQIAQSRVITRAAVKPRLRVMSEIVAEANPHRYSEIEGQTVNLILKAPREDDSGISQWVTDQFSADHLRAQMVSDDTMTISDEDHSIACRVVPVKHALNGLHVVVQAKLRLHAYS